MVESTYVRILSHNRIKYTQISHQETEPVRAHTPSLQITRMKVNITMTLPSSISPRDFQPKALSGSHTLNSQNRNQSDSLIHDKLKISTKLAHPKEYSPKNKHCKCCTPYLKLSRFSMYAYSIKNTQNTSPTHLNHPHYFSSHRNSKHTFSCKACYGKNHSSVDRAKKVSRTNPSTSSTVHRHKIHTKQVFIAQAITPTDIRKPIPNGNITTTSSQIAVKARAVTQTESNQQIWPSPKQQNRRVRNRHFGPKAIRRKVQHHLYRPRGANHTFLFLVGVQACEPTSIYIPLLQVINNHTERPKTKKNLEETKKTPTFSHITSNSIPISANCKNPFDHRSSSVTGAQNTPLHSYQHRSHTKVMTEDITSASEDEYWKGAQEHEYLDIAENLQNLKVQPTTTIVPIDIHTPKGVPENERSNIAGNLKNLKVQPNTTIVPSDIRTPKRKNSSPDEKTETKRRLLNPMAPPTFNEVVQKTLWVVDIVIDSDEEIAMTRDQSELIKEELTKALFASDKLGTLDFDHCGYERNLYRTISRNTETRDWVLVTIPTLKFEKWPEAKLKTVEAGKTPKLVRASIILDYPTPDFGEVFQIIDARNRDINTKFWRLYKKHKVDKGKQLWNIGIDEESAKAIKTMEFFVQYGLNKLKMSIHDAKPKK